MKLTTTLALLTAILGHTAFADVGINEIMASNGSTIADEDGDFQDWIELVNSGTETIDLSGWGLSDNPSNPFKWKFPGGASIEPGEFLLVWASEKDRQDVYNRQWAVPHVANSVGIWQFREGVGAIANDLSPNARNATLTGNYSWLKRKQNTGALDLQPTAKAELPALVEIPGDFTIAYWFNTRSSNFWWLLNRASSSQGIFGHRTDSQVAFSGPFAVINLNRPLPANAWHHIVVTRSANQVTVYANGTLAGQGVWNGTLRFEQFGGLHTGSTWPAYDGSVSDLMVKSSALSGAEIAPLFEEQKAGLLHTNYSISSSGEPISLVNGSGILVDTLPAVVLPRDISFGKHPDGSDENYFFSEATPAASNNTVAYSEILDPPVFSHPPGFHPSAFSLSLGHPDPQATIIYTLDGSVPSLDNLDGRFYSYKNSYPLNETGIPGPFLQREIRSHEYLNPLPILDRSDQPYGIAGINSALSATPLTPISEPFKGTVVRAVAVKPGALPSKDQTHSYFVHPDGASRYELPVVSLVTSEDNLFDFETGIHVAGRIGEETALNPLTPNRGNFNQSGSEWERPLHLEFFDQSGNIGFSADVGTLVHGGVSRGYPRKTLRALFRTRHGTPELDYPLFGSLPAKDGSGNSVESFRAFLMRNSGGDHSQTLIRDAMQIKLIDHLPLATQAYRPAIQFINGEYWGIINLREKIDEDYLASHYGVDPEQVTILLRTAVVNVGTDEDRQNYLSIVDYATTNDLSQPSHYEWVSDKVDIRDMILYFAAQIYIANHDWPHNNIKFWRLRLPENQPLAPVGKDGRWRFLTFDIEAGHHGYEGSTRTAIDSLSYVLDYDTLPVVKIFRELMNNSSFRDQFINTLADMMNTIFLAERTEAVIDEMNAVIANSRAEHFQRWRGGNNLGDFMKNFANQRPAFVRQHIMNRFSLASSHQLTLGRDGVGGHLRINETELTAKTPGVSAEPYPWTGTYFEGVPVTITAVPEPGYIFTGWAELPDEESAKIEVSLTSNATFTAVFEELPPVPVPLTIHGWDFEGISGFLNFSQSLVPGAALTVTLGPTTEVVRNTASQDFTTAHLRVNNPLGSTASFSLPTTGFESITLDYLTRRSGQGAGEQVLSYTLNGSDWIELESYIVADAAPQAKSFDFSAISGTNDNPDFAIRINFGQADGDTAGNNRFDDVTLSGFPLPDANLPPDVNPEALPSGIPTLRASGAPLFFNLAEIFSDPNSDSLTFTAISSNPSIATAEVNSESLSVFGHSPGEAILTIEAEDGVNAPTSTSFFVQVHPEAHSLVTSAFTMSEWDASNPTMTYPANMIFLQSEVNDPSLATNLNRAYHIPLEDGAVPADADFPYAATSRTRINGLGDAGIAFINTGRGRDVGAALAAIDTTGIDAATVSFTAGTLAVNNRIYAIRLQYRVGSEGPFLDVTDGLANPVEYIRSITVENDIQVGPIPLPSNALGKPYVQLLWRYHYLSGSGSRAQLRLDDIVVSGSGQGPTFARWREDEFSQAELLNLEISGADVDPNGSGIANLMRYALGLGRNDNPIHFLPELSYNGQSVTFSFPFDPAKIDLIYRVTRSANLSDWDQQIFDSSTDDWESFLEEGWIHITDNPDLNGSFYRLEVETR